MKSMTNTKAFWICFFAPFIFGMIAVLCFKMLSLIVYGEPLPQWMTLFLPTNESIFSGDPRILIVWILAVVIFFIFVAGFLFTVIGAFLALTSQVILPFLIGKKYGQQFRKYGFYGSLVSILAFLFFIVPLFHFIKII